METVWRFLKKLKIELPCDLAIPILGTTPKKMKSLYRGDICTPMFIEALCTIAKKWRQPKCPSMDEWIKKLVVYTHTHTHTHTHTMEYYSVIKKKEILSFATTWMDLKGTV